MAARLTEEIIGRMTEILQANLPAEIAVTRAQEGESPPLDVVPASSYRIAPMMGLRAPFVVLEATELVFEPDSAENFVNGTLSVRAIVVSENREYELLTRQAWRYAVSAYRALHDQVIQSLDRQLQGRVRVASIAYQDWADADPDKAIYRRAATLNCSVRFQENF